MERYAAIFAGYGGLSPPIRSFPARTLDTGSGPLSRTAAAGAFLSPGTGQPTGHLLAVTLAWKAASLLSSLDANSPIKTRTAKVVEYLMTLNSLEKFAIYHDYTDR